MKRVTLLLALAVFLFTGCLDSDGEKAAVEADKPLAQTFVAGMQAYKAGDYQTAFRVMKYQAEQGHERAQYNLGSMYESGQGTERNYNEAFKWYQKSAEQGNIKSQNNLALMYMTGRGTQQNLAEGFKWWTIAAKYGNESARQNLEKAWIELKPEDVAKGEEMAYAWKPLQETKSGENK